MSDVEKLVENLNEKAMEWDNKNNELTVPVTGAPSPHDYAYGYHSGVARGFENAAIDLRAAIAKDGERDRKLVEALLKIKKYYRTSTFSRRVAESALAAYDPQAQPKEGEPTR